MSSSIIHLPILLVGVMLASIVSLIADDKFDAKIDRDKMSETTTIRIRIPKSAHSEPIEAISLKRKSAAGFDLIIPIKAQENAEEYSIFMMLPSSIVEGATITVRHIRPGPLNKDGTFTSLPFVRSSSETYDICLSQIDPR